MVSWLKNVSLRFSPFNMGVLLAASGALPVEAVDRRRAPIRDAFGVRVTSIPVTRSRL